MNYAISRPLNTPLLYHIVTDTFKPEGYDPKDLDIDLRNLAKDGYITYDGDVSRIGATERGKDALWTIMSHIKGADLNLSEDQVETLMRIFDEKVGCQ